MTALYEILFHIHSWPKSLGAFFLLVWRQTIIRTPVSLEPLHITNYGKILKETATFEPLDRRVILVSLFLHLFTTVLVMWCHTSERLTTV